MGIKQGDRVRFLNSVGGGIVTKIDSGIAHVEDEDGFITPVLLKELVVISETSSKTIPSSSVAQTIVESIEWGKEERMDNTSAHELPPFVETPEGEKLNILLAFLPNDIKKLSETSFDTYLINDSNYWLSFIYLSKESVDDKWNLRYVNTIEPGTQLFIEEIEKHNLTSINRICFQFIAFKRDKAFLAKRPYTIEEKIDLTKFFKLHCFTQGEYFDEEVLTVELVKDDKPVQRIKTVELKKLEEEALHKKASDLKPPVRRIKKRTLENDPLAPLVVDLHIEELVDNIRGMTAADILNRQVDEFRYVMDANRQHKGKKIVFIHGKGEGVLRNALLKELNHSYKGNEVQDASFREYGFGATQVIIR